MEAGIQFIQDLAIILAVAAVVGWICQRLGMSVVVGFLVAGLVVGPHTPPIDLVKDIERVDMLAQVGLVFLMFGIGLKLSIRKLRRLGPTLLLAVACTAIAMYYLTRILGWSIGLGKAETIFLAGMLMVSSSAIISKVLHESGVTHERFGQLAMGVAVLEDVVAVVMLTILNSVILFGAGGSTQGEMVGTLGRLSAFVVVAGIGGLLLVPWLLKRMSIAADEELQTLGIAGLLFVFTMVAVKAEYSPALGAFLLGTIVAETPHRSQVERTFEGMRDVFSAIFFVAIGMQIEPRLLADSAWLIVGIAVFTIVGRTLAASLGLTLIGTPPKDSLRAGMAVTPIGEFSFVIAQLGVGAHVLDAKFYPIAVGVCLLTTLMAPVTTRRSEKLADWLLARQPHWLATGLQQYRDWRERVQARRSRNIVWQLSRKRVLQLTVGILFVTGVMVFSEQVFAMLEDKLTRDWLFPHGLEVMFWAGLLALTIAPLVAIWRNISAMAMLYAEVSTKDHGNHQKMRPFIETLIKIGAAVVLLIWLTAILPNEQGSTWLLFLTIVVAAGAVIGLRRKLIYWHSELEVGLQDILVSESHRMTATTAPWLRQHEDWKLHMADCTLPDLADCQGRRIADLELRTRVGCTVVGIERQGFMISLPPAETVLYPRDKVLLMGTTAQLAEGRKYLTAVSGVPPALSVFEEVRMEAVPVPDGSPALGRSLGEIAPTRNYGVLLAGINRGGMRILNPSAEEKLYVADEVLALGTPDQIDAFKAWLRSEQTESSSVDPNQTESSRVEPTQAE